MKKITILLFFICTSIVAFAQDDFIDFESFDVSEPATVKGQAVLIVPFSNDMFNNQESETILMKSKLEYEQSVNYFKSSLDSSIFDALDDSCKAISMLTAFATGTSSDLEKIHGAARYYLAEKTVFDSKDKNSMFRNEKSTVNSVTARDKYIQNGEIVSEKQDMKNTYISVKFDDNMLINSIALKYGAKYLLFINQFDILGDFSDPYRVAEKSYDRIIKVHYALFSSSGDFIQGDAVEYTFPALDDDIALICRQNFPPIAQLIAKQVPK